MRVWLTDSKKRTAAALAELFGTPIPEGTVGAMSKRAADGRDHFLDLVKERIAETEGSVSTRHACEWRARFIGCTAPVPASTQ